MSFITQLFQYEIMIECFVQPFFEARGPAENSVCGDFGRNAMQREEGAASVFGSVLKVLVSRLL